MAPEPPPGEPTADNGARSREERVSFITALSNVSLLSALFSLSGFAVLLAAYGYYIIKVVLITFSIPQYLVGADLHLFAENAVGFLITVGDSIIYLPITIFFTPGISAVVFVLTAVVFFVVAARAAGSALRPLAYTTPVMDVVAVLSFFVAYYFSIISLMAATDLNTITGGRQNIEFTVIGLNTIIGGLSLMSLGYFILILLCLLAPRWKTYNRLAAGVYALLLAVNLLQVPQYWGVYMAFYAPLPVVETAHREYVVLIRGRDRIFLYDPALDKTIVRRVGLDDKYVVVRHESRAEYILSKK